MKHEYIENLLGFTHTLYLHTALYTTAHTKIFIFITHFETLWIAFATYLTFFEVIPAIEMRPSFVM